MTLQELDARIDARIRTVLEGTGSRASSWAQAELARAMAHGITDGTRPGGYATREEAAPDGRARIFRARIKSGPGGEVIPPPGNFYGTCRELRRLIAVFHF